jgi:hypothetical protein
MVLVFFAPQSIPAVIIFVYPPKNEVLKCLKFKAPAALNDKCALSYIFAINAYALGS